MTTQTKRPGTKPVAYGESRGSGMLIYAAVLLGVIGFFNLLDGITAVANSSFFAAGTRYVVGDLRAWGIVVIVIGGLELFAAVGVMAGNQLARWFGVAVLGMNAVAQMFFIPSYPFWSLMILAVDVVGIYALCMFGGAEEAWQPPSQRQPGTESLYPPGVTVTSGRPAGHVAGPPAVRTRSPRCATGFPSGKSGRRRAAA